MSDSSSAGFIDRTFQLISGVGGWRERDLWARGISNWAEFEAAANKGVVMSAKLDGPLLEHIAQAREALTKRDLAALSKLLPIREHGGFTRPLVTKRHSSTSKPTTTTCPPWSE